MKYKNRQKVPGHKKPKITSPILLRTRTKTKKAIIPTSRRLGCRRKSELLDETEQNTDEVSKSPEKAPIAANRSPRRFQKRPHLRSKTTDDKHAKIAKVLFPTNPPFPESGLCAGKNQRSQGDHEDKIGAVVSPKLPNPTVTKTRLERKRACSASASIVSPGELTDKSLIEVNLPFPSSLQVYHQPITTPVNTQSQLELDSSKEPKIPKLDASTSNGGSHEVILNHTVNSTLPVNVAVSKRRLICECARKGAELPLSSDDVKGQRTCGAIEGVGSKSLGCCSLPSDGHTYEVSHVNSIYRLLCSNHLHRLRSHECCPICGSFCTEGEEIVVCEKTLNGSRNLTVHFFHKSCAFRLTITCPTTKFSCPHCGETEGLIQKTFQERSSGFERNILLHSPVPNSSAFSTLTKPARQEDRVFELVEETSLSRLLSEYRAEELDQVPHIFPLTDELFLEAIDKRWLTKVYKHLASSGDPNIPFPSRNMRTPVHLAVEAGDVALLHIICDAELTNVNIFDADGVTPLMVAAQLNNTIAVEYLISVNADHFIQDKNGFTVMHHAVQEKKEDMVKLLLDYDESLINIRDNMGLTPLMLAAKNNFRGIANLISKFLDSNRRAVLEIDNELNTSLHWAAKLGSLPVFLRLLANGAYLDVRNSAGETPLLLAMKNGQFSLVACLLNKGADPLITDREGTSLLDLCTKDEPGSKSSKEVRYKHSVLKMLKQMTRKTDDWRSRPVGKHFSLNDIAKGNENFRIPCLNLVNEETLPDFIYTTSMTGHQKIPVGSIVPHDCRCSSSSLSAENPGELVYDQNQRLFQNTDEDSELNLKGLIVNECGSQCPCDRRQCKNRVVQNGIQSMLQVFYTPVRNAKTKGWGVKTLTTITKGSFICEYIGEILTSTEMQSRADESYSIELTHDEEIPSERFFIDSKFKGNLARFINHSCNSNAMLVRVLVPEGAGSHVPRIALFARKTILSNEEITFNYGKRFFKSRQDRDENFLCLCGTKECTFGPSNTKSSENSTETESNGHD